MVSSGDGNCKSEGPVIGGMRHPQAHAIELPTNRAASSVPYFEFSVVGLWLVGFESR